MRFWFSILFGIVIFGAMIFSAIGHEELHKIIFDEYGINITITYFDGLSFNTVTTPDKNSSGVCNDYCQLSHNINEAIAYNLESYFVMIGIGMFIIIIVLESMKED